MLCQLFASSAITIVPTSPFYFPQCNTILQSTPPYTLFTIKATFGATFLYKYNAAIASTPAATAPKLATLRAAAPVKGVGVELEVVVLLLPLLLLLLFVELLIGKKLAQVSRVVL